MKQQFPTIPFERYADDGVAHCVSLKQAKYLIKKLNERFLQCGLELNLAKTKIVYCKDSDRHSNYENISFDFLGYTFRPRGAKNKQEKIFTSFLPAMSDKAQKSIREEMKSWKLQLKSDKDILDISLMFNSKLQGWINYYSHFYKSEMNKVLKYFNKCLVRWVRRKYKKRNSNKRARAWLLQIAKREPKLFAHWKMGILPTA